MSSSGGRKRGSSTPNVDLMGNMARINWASDTAVSDREYYLPPMDVYEKGDRLVIEMELPGVKKESINLFATDEMITVEGIKTEVNIGPQASGQRVSYLQIERKFGRFYREIELPAACDLNDIRASHNKGILLIEVRIIEDRRGRKKRITIE